MHYMQSEEESDEDSGRHCRNISQFTFESGGSDLSGNRYWLSVDKTVLFETATTVTRSCIH